MKKGLKHLETISTQVSLHSTGWLTRVETFSHLLILYYTIPNLNDPETLLKTCREKEKMLVTSIY